MEKMYEYLKLIKSTFEFSEYMINLEKIDHALVYYNKEIAVKVISDMVKEYGNKINALCYLTNVCAIENVNLMEQNDSVIIQQLNTLQFLISCIAIFDMGIENFFDALIKRGGK